MKLLRNSTTGPTLTNFPTLSTYYYTTLFFLDFGEER
jgi:hypothetical protein